MRTIIDLPTEQLNSLSVLCEQEHLSRAEVIRRAIALYVEERLTPNLGEAFGLWRKRKKHVVDGLIYQQRLRNEW